MTAGGLDLLHSCYGMSSNVIVVGVCTGAGVGFTNRYPVPSCAACFNHGFMDGLPVPSLGMATEQLQVSGAGGGLVKMGMVGR